MTYSKVMNRIILAFACDCQHSTSQTSYRWLKRRISHNTALCYLLRHCYTVTNKQYNHCLFVTVSMMLQSASNIRAFNIMSHYAKYAVKQALFNSKINNVPSQYFQDYTQRTAICAFCGRVLTFSTIPKHIRKFHYDHLGQFIWD